jgi:hypothetical protein
LEAIGEGIAEEIVLKNCHSERRVSREESGLANSGKTDSSQNRLEMTNV